MHSAGVVCGGLGAGPRSSAAAGVDPVSPAAAVLQPWRRGRRRHGSRTSLLPPVRQRAVASPEGNLGIALPGRPGTLPPGPARAPRKWTGLARTARAADVLSAAQLPHPIPAARLPGRLLIRVVLGADAGEHGGVL